MPDHVCTQCGHVDSDTVIEPSQDVFKRVRFPRKVLRDKIEWDSTYHPGVKSEDLYHEVHDTRVSDRGPYPTVPITEIWDGRRNLKQLCHNCGWSSANELDSGGYTSRLKVAYLRDNSAIWDLGPNGPWMLRDETNNSTDVWKVDYTVQQFIRAKKPSIPLVEMHKFGGPDDKFHFTLMARAKGSTLFSMTDILTPEQMSDVLRDLREHIKQFRQITSPQMQRVDGSELRDAYIGNCTGHGCIKTGHNEEEWLENLTPALRKGMLWPLWMRHRGPKADQIVKDSWIKEVDEKVAQLKANFPRGGPYVLTHGDLHFHNVFVSDDNPEKKFKISAIIDWEMAGFFPWWVEYCRSQHPGEILGEEDTTNFYYPEHTSEDWNNIRKAVKDMREAWSTGGYHGMSKHGMGDANFWFRQPFCACKPFAQEYRDSYLGVKQEHMDLFPIDSSDSEDDEEQDRRPEKFDKKERQFIRWFYKIQWPNQTNNDN